MNKAFTPLDANGKKKKHRTGKALTGFTLLEVLLAIFLITIGIGGVFALIWQTAFFTESSFAELTAAYLLQEGLEIVKNIRDSNWLTQRTTADFAWDSGLDECASGCQADYDDEELTSYTDDELNFSAGFYSYEPGAQTKFKRKITIIKPSDDALEVIVEVMWLERGKNHKLIAQENLYNWR